MVKELEQKGFNKFKISKEIKVHEYKVQKAMGFARSYSVKDLKRITKMAYDIDYQHKSGLLDTQLGLEMLIASIWRRCEVVIYFQIRKGANDGDP